MSGYIISKASGLNGAVNLGKPLVMDIAASSQSDYVPMQVWGQDPGTMPNQQWDFPADPNVPGYFHIKSELDGAHLGAPAGWPEFQDVVADKPSNVEDDRFRWRAVEDLNGSGFCYLQNKLIGLVIGIEGGSHQQGGKLVLVNPVAGHDSQLWQGSFPDTVSLSTEFKLPQQGSGTGYFGSGPTKCTVAVNLDMKSDGNCAFTGKYANCGDVPLVTAGPQNFAVALVVHDLAGAWYSFCQGGYADDLENISWGTPGVSSFVRENWVSIILRNQCSFHWLNGEASNGENSGAFDWNVETIEGLMQQAVADGQGGSIFGWSVPNVIYQDISSPPFGNQPTGFYPGVNGGSFPTGWQPSGSGRGN